MAIDEVQAERREMLRLAAEKAGGKAPLGRLLGYVDGAYVGQMIRGERPVKEDTIAKLEQKPGFQSWFSKDPQARLPFRDLKGSEVLAIALFRRLSPERQQELLVELEDELNQPEPTAEQKESTSNDRRRSDRRSATYIDERGFASPNRRRAA